MNHSSALSLIAGKPLAVTPAKLQAITGYLQTRASFEIDFSGVQIKTGEAVQAAERDPNGSGTQYGDDVALIAVTGSLVNRSASGSSGMTNYRRFQSRLGAAIDDRDIGGVLLDFQTSGGMVVGCQRTYNLIRQAAQIKPVWAFIDAYAYSAGFYMACAASKVILADQHCGVGSVGVLAVVLDQSKKLKKEGLVYNVIQAGVKKTRFSTLAPMADDERAELQESVDRTRLIFADDVATAMGMTQAAVLATEADVYEGQDAIDIGFADEIASFEDTVGMLREEIAGGSGSGYYNQNALEAEEVEFMVEKGGGMTTAQRIGAMLGADPEGFAAAMETFGFQSAASVNAQFGDLRTEYFDKGKVEGVEEGKQAGLDQAVAVLAAAELGGMPVADAKGLVAEGLTQDKAAERVQAYNANASALGLTSSVVTPLTGEGEHPFLSYGDGN